MMTSDNGYPVIQTAVYTGPFPRLRHFNIPGVKETIALRDGSCGFLLVHFAMWYNVSIRAIDGPRLDDWGWNFRRIAGTDVYSNHASGTAEDLNALAFPQGTENMTAEEVRKIHKRLKLYGGAIRWGGDYVHAKKDQMHFEINQPIGQVETTAKRLMDSWRGKHVLSRNPGLKKAILS